MSTHTTTRGQAHQALRDTAVAALNAAIDTHHAQMHPDDVTGAPRDLVQWMDLVDQADESTLRDYVALVEEGIKNARGDRSPRGLRYVALRTPFLDYGTATLSRRFPEDASQVAQDRASQGAGEVIERVTSPTPNQALKEQLRVDPPTQSAGVPGAVQCDQLVRDPVNGTRKCAFKAMPGDTLCKRHRAQAQTTGYTAARLVGHEVRRD